MEKPIIKVKKNQDGTFTGHYGCKHWVKSTRMKRITKEDARSDAEHEIEYHFSIAD